MALSASHTPDIQPEPETRWLTSAKVPKVYICLGYNSSPARHYRYGDKYIGLGSYYTRDQVLCIIITVSVVYASPYPKNSTILYDLCVILGDLAQIRH